MPSPLLPSRSLNAHLTGAPDQHYENDDHYHEKDDQYHEDDDHCDNEKKMMLMKVVLVDEAKYCEGPKKGWVLIPSALAILA